MFLPYQTKLYFLTETELSSTLQVLVQCARYLTGRVTKDQDGTDQ